MPKLPTSRLINITSDDCSATCAGSDCILCARFHRANFCSPARFCSDGRFSMSALITTCAMLIGLHDLQSVSVLGSSSGARVDSSIAGFPLISSIGFDKSTDCVSASAGRAVTVNRNAAITSLIIFTPRWPRRRRASTPLRWRCSSQEQRLRHSRRTHRRLRLLAFRSEHHLNRWFRS